MLEEQRFEELIFLHRTYDVLVAGLETLEHKQL